MDGCDAGAATAGNVDGSGPSSAGEGSVEEGGWDCEVAVVGCWVWDEEGCD